MTSIASAITGSGAKKAGQAQARAGEEAIGVQRESLASQLALARESLELQKEMFDTATGYGEPYRAAGNQALAQYESLIYGIPLEQTMSYRSIQQQNEHKAALEARAGRTKEELAKLLPSNVHAWGKDGIDYGELGGPRQWQMRNGNLYVRGDESSSWEEVDPLAAPDALSPTHYTQDGNADARMEAMVKTPGYQFRLTEGEKALERSAAARSGVLSGAQIKATARYGQDFATNEFDNTLRRVGALVDTGAQMAGAAGNQAMTSSGQQGGVLSEMMNANRAFGDNVSGLKTNIGAARASGYLGEQAAGTNLINQGFGLAGSIYGA